MNVSAGKYFPGKSFIHRIDPRVKLLTNILFIVLVFLTKDLLLLGILLSPLLIFYIWSGLKPRQLIRMFYPILMIGTFLFVINIFVIKGMEATSVYATWWKLTISDLAIYRTILIMIRIYVMMIVTTLLTSTTRPMALTKAIEDLLFPLKIIFIPVNIIAMIISIALRFIPTLLEEAQRIMKAQASRGVDFKNGNIKSKSKAMITLIVPLFVSAFNKAEDLGNAMETRGYDPYEKRTRYRDYPIKWLDFVVVLFVAGLLSMVIIHMNGLFILPSWL